MRILLIRPPYNRLKDYHPAPYFPLGIGYIAAVLEQDGHDVKIWNADATVGFTAGVMPDELTMLKERQHKHDIYLKALQTDDHPIWEEVRSVLDECDPDIVGVSVLTPETGSAAKLSQIVKEKRKDRLVVWGGHHATFLSEDVLGYQDVDVVVRGEGEIPMSNLVAAYEKGPEEFLGVKGISYVSNGQVVHNPDEEYVEDLDKIPFPAHHLSLFPEAYKRMDRIGLMTNRGCPFKCGYCSSPKFTRKNVRYRSYDNVIDEIKYVTAFYKKNVVSFLDDNFTISRKKVTDLCHHLIDRQIRVSWDTMTRADILDEEVMKLLKQAGCVGITIGIESGCERVLLEQIKKGVKLEKVHEAYELLYKYDIPSGANFIIGFPEETVEDIQKTFSLMQSLKTVNINFNIFEPIPGSPLLDVSRDIGVLPKEIDWRTFGFWPMNHFVKNISTEEFTRLAFEITQWVYDYKCSMKVRWMRIKPYIKNDPLFPLKKVYKSLKVRILNPFLKGR